MKNNKYYNYEKQAWVIDGVFARCGHKDECSCYGKKHEGERTYICVLCKRTTNGYGNNPAPLSETGQCCDECNIDVMNARLRELGVR